MILSPSDLQIYLNNARCRAQRICICSRKSACKLFSMKKREMHREQALIWPGISNEVSQIGLKESRAVAHSSPPVSQFKWHNVCVSLFEKQRRRRACLQCIWQSAAHCHSAVRRTGQAKMALICIRNTWNSPTAGQKSNSMFVWPVHICRGETFGTELSTGRNAASNTQEPPLFSC